MTQIGENAAGGNAQTAIVQEGAAALFRREQFVRCRIEDDAGHDFTIALQCDGDRELRNAVQEVGRAIERIDDPAVGAIGALFLLAFLAEETVGGAGLQKLVTNDLFRLQVCLGHEVARPLTETCRFCNLAEIARQRLPALRAA